MNVESNPVILSAPEAVTLRGFRAALTNGRTSASAALAQSQRIADSPDGLLDCAKALALVEGRSVASIEDVRAVALPVLRHRILVNFQAEADGIDAEEVVGRLLQAIRP